MSVLHAAAPGSGATLAATLWPTAGSAADAPMIESWAVGSGRSLGRGDLAVLTRHQPGGLLIGILNRRPVSAIATVGHDTGLYFTSAPIVDPAFRGRAIEEAAAELALRHLADSPVALEAPPEMRDFFAARGFYTSWRTIAFGGPVPAPRPSQAQVVSLDAELLGQAVALDMRCFPADRSALTTDWACEKDRYAVGFVQSNRLLGYGVIRPAFGAARIGPLYATTIRVAAALFDALAGHAGQHGARAVAIDVPEPNTAALALCESRGLSFDTETLRMNRPSARMPQQGVDLTVLYGLTSRELG